MDEFLARVFDHQGLMAAFVTVVLVGVAEFGYRRGLRLHAATDEPRRSQIAAVQAAVLGLLALLLGFTFSMAVERYDDRRELVVTEANTVKAAWLRGGLLPDEHRHAVRHLLRDYVGVRVLSPEARKNPQQVLKALRASRQIQAKLWGHAEAAAGGAPNDITATFIETLNTLIETDTARVAASRNRIPSGVWLILIVVAAVGCWTSTYAAGAAGVRSPLASVLLPLLISVVILLTLDLTNERHGMISVSQQPLIDLQDSIR